MAAIIKGEKRGRPGKWIVDYRDATGRRRWITCKTKRRADDVLAEKIREAKQHIVAEVEPNITVEQYSVRWVERVKATTKERTANTYQRALHNHILPSFGRMKVRDVHPGRVIGMLTQKLNEGYAKAYVRLIHATFEGMLNAAVDDGIILANPAAKMGRKMRLVQTRAAKQEEIKAFTREQRDHFLAVTLAHKPKLYALFLLMTRTGLRPGEAVALKWVDVNLHPEERSIRVERTLSARKISTPKSGHGRSVDVSAELRVTLLKLQVERKEETLRKSWGTVPEWVFCSRVGRIVDYSWVAKDFGRLLRFAGLPSHFTPHCLRHTYASLLLQTGISPVYVQRQLGHASIQMTCDLYGKWLPIGEKSWVDGLDSSATQRNGSKMVANGDFRGRGPRTMEARHVGGSPEAIDFPMVSQDDQVRSPTSTASPPAPAAPRRSSSARESQRTASRWRSLTSRPTSHT